MRIYKTVFLFCLTFCLFLVPQLAWAQLPTTPTTGSEQASPSVDYAIGKGDILDIQVVDQAQMSGKFRVTDSGTIAIPFVDQIQVAGLTEAQVTDVLKDKLKKYIRQPELKVTVSEFNSRFVTILGAVKLPGRYSLRQGVRLLDVVGMAGGLSERTGIVINVVHYPTPDANGLIDAENIKVVSVNLKDLLEGHPELNHVVQSGDLINVPDADTIYVTGNVNKPGSFNTQVPVTLTQALALAGGMSPEAQRSQISLYRVKPGEAERTELVYDLSALEKRKVKDPIILPNDVIYVRGSAARSLGMSFLRAVTGSLGASLGLGVIR